MKKLIYLACVLASTSVFAQKNITLNLNPMFGGQALVLNQNYTNANGKETQITRGQYFVSQIKLIHDGGQTLSLPNTFLRTNVTTISYSLGSQNITNLEGIEFSVGVPNAENHADPTQWPAGHALALQNPSMHWGWSAGYMFAYIAGDVDDDGNNVPETGFEFAPVADKYLTDVSLTTSGTVSGNDIDIDVWVNFKSWLKNMNLATVGFSHGSTTPNNTFMNNIVPENVFTVTAPMSVNDYTDNVAVTAYPNPFKGKMNINYDFAGHEQIDFYVMNLSGQLINEQLNVDHSGEISFQHDEEEILIYYFKNESGEILYTEKVQSVK